MRAKPILAVEHPRFTNVEQAQRWADSVYRWAVSVDSYLDLLQKEVRGKVAKSVFRGFTVTNLTETRTMDADTATEPVIADVLGTVIQDAGEA